MPARRWCRPGRRSGAASPRRAARALRAAPARRRRRVAEARALPTTGRTRGRRAAPGAAVAGRAAVQRQREVGRDGAHPSSKGDEASFNRAGRPGVAERARAMASMPLPSSKANSWCRSARPPMSDCAGGIFQHPARNPACTPVASGSGRGGTLAGPLRRAGRDDRGERGIDLAERHLAELRHHREASGAAQPAARRPGAGRRPGQASGAKSISAATSWRPRRARSASSGSPSAGIRRCSRRSVYRRWAARSAPSATPATAACRAAREVGDHRLGLVAPRARHGRRALHQRDVCARHADEGVEHAGQARRLLRRAAGAAAAVRQAARVPSATNQSPVATVGAGNIVASSPLP